MQSVLLKHGFHLWAVADAEWGGEELEAEARYKEWLSMGNAAGMHWLEKHAELKFHPDRLLKGARSVLVVTLPYWQKRPQESPTQGRVARYAWGRDYHRVFQARLKALINDLGALLPGERFRCGADSHPLGEVHWAQKSGLGFRGRNTLLITRRYGSYHLLGVIMTTAVLPLKNLEKDAHACPSRCFLCGQNCPTGALQLPGFIDARRCIAYWTIETLDPVPRELRAKFGNWIFGCDLCQDACPWNRDIESTSEEEFLSPSASPHIELASVLMGTEEEWQPRLEGTPLRRAGFIGLVRNACLAVGNSGRKELAPLLEPWVDHQHEGVREHALWARSHLMKSEEKI